MVGFERKLRRLIPSSRVYNVGLSRRLTKSIHRLNPDFQDVFIIVRKDRRNDKNHSHFLNLMPYYQFGHYLWIGCPMEMDCSLAAKILLEICNNSELADLRSGIELIIAHDRGHFKLPEKPLILCYPGGQEFCHSKYSFSEAFAQLYALNKVEGPIGAMAAALAIQRFITKSLSLKKHLTKMLSHWRELVDWYWEERYKIVYHFPLNEKAISEIIKKAAKLEATLKKYLDEQGRFKNDASSFLLNF